MATLRTDPVYPIHSSNPNAAYPAPLGQYPNYSGTFIPSL